MLGLKTAVGFFLLLSSLVIQGGPIVEISDTKGRTLKAELISVDETSADLRKSAGQKPFTVEFSTLQPVSIELLKKQGALVPVKYPKFEVDVVVSKRRKDTDGSWYMKAMTVGAKVKIFNESMKKDFPKTEGRLVFVGQNQRYENQYTVLAVRDFKFAPKAGQEVEIELKEFLTKYDSDNKGEGNIGGFKYDGYLLIFHNEDKITYHKSMTSQISNAIEENPEVLPSFLKIQENTKLSESMVPN